MLDFLAIAVRARKNILISGGTGAGKSTLLGALAEVIPDGERIVMIEDTAELNLDQEHVVRHGDAARRTSRGADEIRHAICVINALRMRPDRIIVGEVRGGEALDMLQAMNTGHDGGICTIHANSSRDALARLETMVLMAGIDLPSRAIREQIVSALHLLVHIRRYDDGVRRIESIAEITGLEGLTPLMQELFGFKRRGREGRHVIGHFTAMGVVPQMVEELRERGVHVPVSMFQRYAGAGLVTALAVVLLLVGTAAVLWSWYAYRARRLTVERLAEMVGAEAEPEKREDQLIRASRSYPPRYRYAPVSVGCIVAALAPVLRGLAHRDCDRGGSSGRRDRAPGRGAGC